MSVLVKGWTIPKGCADCPTWCKLYLQRREFRHPDCPLIEVPTPHGRLIDADFEEQHYTSMTTNPTPDVTEQDKRNSLIIIEALQMAKTVIEAEE